MGGTDGTTMVSGGDTGAGAGAGEPGDAERDGGGDDFLRCSPPSFSRLVRPELNSCWLELGVITVLLVPSCEKPMSDRQRNVERSISCFIVVVFNK